jgi:hypothetical protein
MNSSACSRANVFSQNCTSRPVPLPTAAALLPRAAAAATAELQQRAATPITHLHANKHNKSLSRGTLDRADRAERAVEPAHAERRQGVRRLEPPHLHVEGRRLP